MLKNQACLEPSAFAGFRQSQDGYFPFTMVPNQFFTEILPFEKPCVIKVICFVLRRTIGWVDHNGQRKQQQQIAYSEFARELDMSMQAVTDGLKIALAKGYIVRTRPGGLHSGPGGASEGAWYSLRWTVAAAEAEQISNATDTHNLSPVAVSQPVTPGQPKNPIPPSETNPTQAKALPLFTVQTESKKAKVQSKTYSNNQIDEPQSVTLNFRDMINKGKSNSIKKLESNRKNHSTYIGNVIAEIGTLFDDNQHRPSNIKQAFNIWSATSLEEGEFVKLLYKARDITRNFTSAYFYKQSNSSGRSEVSPDRSLVFHIERSQKVTPDLGSSANSTPVLRREFVRDAAHNRMPYFFRVLKDLAPSGKNNPLTSTSRPDHEAQIPLAEKTIPLQSVSHKTSPAPATCRKRRSGFRGERITSTEIPQLQAVEVNLTSQQATGSVKPAHESNSPNSDQADQASYQGSFKNNSAKLSASLESQPLSSTPVEVAPVQMPDEYLTLRSGWADRYSPVPTDVLNFWDRIIAGTDGTELNVITKKMLGITASKVRPELLTCCSINPTRAIQLEGSIPTANQNEPLEMILMFRNPFDMRYAARHLTALQEIIEQVSHAKVMLYLAHS